MLERWARFVIRFRWLVLVFWAAVLLTGGAVFGNLNRLLSNEFTVPGTDSERVRSVLARHFGDRSDGSFTVVFEVPRADPETRLRLQVRVERAARAVPSGRARELLVAGRHVVYGDVTSTLALARAKDYTD